MLIGVPREIKADEYRVALTPAGVKALLRRSHKVMVEKNAGSGSGFADEDYLAAGAEMMDTASAVFDQAQMIIKVKEPLPPEYPLLRSDQILFTYLHLAAIPELARQLIESKVPAIGYENVQTANGHLPLLMPMSEVAGRISVQIGAHFLEKHQGGSGVLLGGVPGVMPGEVVIIGGGVVGTEAAKMAVGLGAQVTIIEYNPQRLRYLDDIFGGRIQKIMSNTHNIAQAVKHADLLIGAVLIPGGKAPQLVSEEMVKTMKPGSVIVDVAIDQGGAIETIDRSTTHSHPVYEKHGVLHCAIANLPGAVPRTSTLALTNVTLPYALALADKGFTQAVQDDPALALGVNTVAGCFTCKPVAESLNLKYTPLDEAIKGF
jgi:alanine dehydrogenase